MRSGNGRHRRPKQAPAFVVNAGVTTAGIAIPLLAAGSAAFAADGETWDKVAECESSALWSADTGNGYFGGLQLTREQWDEYGGRDYAERPDYASRGQQIAVGERILEELGTEAFPRCADLSGLRQGAADPEIDPGQDYPDYEREDARSGPAAPVGGEHGGGKHRGAGSEESAADQERGNSEGKGKHRGDSSPLDGLEIDGTVGDPEQSAGEDAPESATPSLPAEVAQGDDGNGRPDENGRGNSEDDSSQSPWGSLGRAVDELPEVVPDSIQPGQSGNFGHW